CPYFFHFLSYFMPSNYIPHLVISFKYTSIMHFTLHCYLRHTLNRLCHSLVNSSLGYFILKTLQVCNRFFGFGWATPKTDYATRKFILHLVIPFEKHFQYALVSSVLVGTHQIQTMPLVSSISIWRFRL